MTPETALGGVESGSNNFDKYFERIANIFVRLKLDPEGGYVRASRQEVFDADLKSLLNGRHETLKGRKFYEPGKFFYAGVEGNEAWVRVSEGNKSLKITIIEGEEFPKGEFQEKIKGRWVASKFLEGISWVDLDVIVKYGEKITGLLNRTGSPQINRLPGEVVGDKSF